MTVNDLARAALPPLLPSPAAARRADDGKPKAIGGVLMEWARFMPLVTASRRAAAHGSPCDALALLRAAARLEDEALEVQLPLAHTPVRPPPALPSSPDAGALAGLCYCICADARPQPVTRCRSAGSAP